jgi:hypothetical protein
MNRLNSGRRFLNFDFRRCVAKAAERRRSPKRFARFMDGHYSLLSNNMATTARTE